MNPQNPIDQHTSDSKALSHIIFSKHQCLGNINQCHMSHNKEKTSFCLSLDERVYVKMLLNTKGYVACPFRHFLDM